MVINDLKQTTAYEILRSLGGSERGIRESTLEARRAHHGFDVSRQEIPSTPRIQNNMCIAIRKMLILGEKQTSIAAGRILEETTLTTHSNNGILYTSDDAEEEDSDHLVLLQFITKQTNLH